MKRTLWILLALTLGVASQSCESATPVEDIVNEPEMVSETDDKEDEEAVPGSN